MLWRGGRAAVPIVLCYCLCGCQGKGKGNSAGELIDDAQELERLTQLAYWKPEQRKYAEAVKKCVIGEGRMAPASNHEGDPKAPCQWDCYRRASMLEPLVAEILHRGVPGDFVEAGVYRGGISVFMAALLRSAGVLGDTPSAGQRRMWLADSFQGLPNEAYTQRFTQTNSGRSAGHTSADIAQMQKRQRMSRGWGKGGHFSGSLEQVKQSFVRCLLPLPDAHLLPPSAPPSGSPQGVHFLVGFFADTLPQAEVRQISLLRADSDIFASIYETLDSLYPRLSVGGYVVFDDWKLMQARASIDSYRQRHNITSPLRGRSRGARPFDSLDRMVFWQKDAVTG